MGVDRYEAARILSRLRGNAPVIAGPGSVSGALYVCGYDPATIYNMELGYPSSMAIGLALATPDQKVVAFEGDGSLLAELGVLATLARYRPANLVVVVMDDGLYTSTADGLQQTATSTGTDLAQVAVACGLNPELAPRVESATDLETALATALSQPGPWVIVCVTAPSPDAGQFGDRPRPQHDIVEVAVNFKREMVDRGYVGSRGDQSHLRTGHTTKGERHDGRS